MATTATRPASSPLGRLVAGEREALASHAAGEAVLVATLLDDALVWTSGLYQAHALLTAARASEERNGEGGGKTGGTA